MPANIWIYPDFFVHIICVRKCFARQVSCPSFFISHKNFSKNMNVEVTKNTNIYKEREDQNTVSQTYTVTPTLNGTMAPLITLITTVEMENIWWFHSGLVWNFPCGDLVLLLSCQQIMGSRHMLPTLFFRCITNFEWYSASCATHIIIWSFFVGSTWWGTGWKL